MPDQLVIADELKGNKIELEGFDLIAVEVGHSDTDHTTCLNVPSIVAWDVAYNDVHKYLAELSVKILHLGHLKINSCIRFVLHPHLQTVQYL